MMYMLHYYRETAHAALPYFKGRPVTLRFFPEGVLRESYYLREGALNARTAFSL
jgi:DNA primase